LHRTWSGVSAKLCEVLCEPLWSKKRSSIEDFTRSFTQIDTIFVKSTGLKKAVP
jgi:hypothetical protein